MPSICESVGHDINVKLSRCEAQKFPGFGISCFPSVNLSHYLDKVLDFHTVIRYNTITVIAEQVLLNSRKIGTYLKGGKEN